MPIDVLVRDDPEALRTWKLHVNERRGPAEKPRFDMDRRANRGKIEGHRRWVNESGDLTGDVRGREALDIEDQVRAGICGPALLLECRDPSERIVAGEHRSFHGSALRCGLTSKTIEEHIRCRFEGDGEGARGMKILVCPNRRDDNGAPTGRDDDLAPSQGAKERATLQPPERGLTVGRENLRDGLPSIALDLGIGIEELPAQVIGKKTSGCALARPAEANKHDPVVGWVIHTLSSVSALTALSEDTTR